MGGNAQYRKKAKEKKYKVPQSAIDQLRARFGDKMVSNIQGSYAEGVAKGIIAAADYFGDEVVKQANVKNGKLPRTVLGVTSVVTGEVTVDEDQGSLDGGLGSNVSTSTVHEVTHTATQFYANDKIREYAQKETELLDKYNLTRDDYRNAVIRAQGGRRKVNLNALTSELPETMTTDDKNALVRNTDTRTLESQRFCSAVITKAARKGNMSTRALAAGISTYAGKSPSEAVSEAVSDVLINGDKASAASKLVYNAYNDLKN